VRHVPHLQTTNSKNIFLSTKVRHVPRLKPKAQRNLVLSTRVKYVPHSKTTIKNINKSEAMPRSKNLSSKIYRFL